MKFELGVTLVIIEGADTVPGALAVVSTVALVLCVMGVQTVPNVLGILSTVGLTLNGVGVVTTKPVAAVVIGSLVFGVVKRLDTTGLMKLGVAV